MPKIYILRADSAGNVYRGDECDAQDYSDMIKITDIQKFALTKNIDILYENFCMSVIYMKKMPLLREKRLTVRYAAKTEKCRKYLREI